jgi:sugar transferase (PEP-CTERM/EpsH1 system associated)
MSTDPRPLVMHVVHRFDTGGLENGVVNLVNHMAPERYRHAVVALTEVTDFRQRVQRGDVLFEALNKPPGQGVWLYPKFMRLLARWRPAVVHTRNFGTLEFQLPAALAGVAGRVHGEHGRDIDDLSGSSRRHRWLRRVYRPFVQHQIALGRDLADYLERDIGVSPACITRIYNGVDAERFQPAPRRLPITGCPYDDPALCLVGTVGRMQAVKNQTALVRAFLRALEQQPSLRARLRLVLIGDGPLRAEALALLEAAGATGLAWLGGERRDIPDILRGLDVFVLPSLAEGISNTVLEAMASGLPVVATDVGANGELVDAGRSGLVVPPADDAALAAALLTLVNDPERARTMGAAGRADAVQRFGIAAMAAQYAAVYDRVLADRSARRER